jgi:hypothetical protein
MLKGRHVANPPNLPYALMRVKRYVSGKKGKLDLLYRESIPYTEFSLVEKPNSEYGKCSHALRLTPQEQEVMLPEHTTIMDGFRL